MTYERIGYQSRSDATLIWQQRLCLSLPLVFFIGVPVIIMTRALLQLHYSERFGHLIPSISKTAAYAPGSHVFAVGMSAVAVCILIAWSLMRRVGYERAMAYAPEDQRNLLLGLSGGASVLGAIAGLMLGALAIISLEDSNDGHMILSALFFAFQVLSFFLDTLFYRRLSRFAAAAGDSVVVSASRRRLWMCLGVFVSAMLFVYMFSNKSQGLFGDQFFAQQVYIFSEHALSFLSLGYPAVIYPDVVRHFRATRAQVKPVPRSTHGT